MKNRQLTMVSRAGTVLSGALLAPEERLVPSVGPVLDHPKGPDWVHPAIFVRNTGVIGLGLFTADLIPRGSTVILFGGTLMSWREVLALPEHMHDIPFQVDDNIFFGIARDEDVGVGERINHSCNPNCGFVSEMKLVALRDILPGEDVTMDYATCTSMDTYDLMCRCGEPNCRGKVTGDDWKLPELQHRLRGYFQPYLQAKIVQQRRRGFKYAVSSMLRSAAAKISPQT